MLRLQGKKVFVTGGSRGIGAGIALAAAKQGASVGISYASRPDSAEKVLSELPGEGHFSVELNVASPESVDKAFQIVFDRFQTVDGLVNNAGVTKDQLLLRMSVDDFDSVIQTNLRGTFLCAKAVLKSMIKARSGSIVNLTSVIGQMGNAGQANYSASKAGIEAFSKSMAKEIGSRGVRVNCVAPGFIQTDMTHGLGEAQKAELLKGTPLNRLGTVEDVASAVCYLLSDESSFITGQTIAVNGGLYM